MINWLRNRRLARRIEELTPSAHEFDQVLKDFPALSGLSRDEAGRLRHLGARILAEKEFTGAAGLEPDYSQCLVVAALAALPVLNLELDWYRDFRTFILYEKEFESEFEETDEAGVVHRGRDLRAGEAWHRGPVVLALADVAQSAQCEGFNVVAHELAHQIDQVNGEADGFPPLPGNIDPEAWTRVFTRAFKRLEEEIDSGREPFLDPYGAESPAEFFAVTTEFFFDVPGWLQHATPDLYALLARFYRQDPALRLGPWTPEAG